jgi:hypothetical protein
MFAIGLQNSKARGPRFASCRWLRYLLTFESARKIWRRGGIRTHGTVNGFRTALSRSGSEVEPIPGPLIWTYSGLVACNGAVFGISGCEPPQPISDDSSQRPPGTFLNKSSPRDQSSSRPPQLPPGTFLNKSSPGFEPTGADNTREPRN